MIAKKSPGAIFDIAPAMARRAAAMDGGRKIKQAAILGRTFHETPHHENADLRVGVFCGDSQAGFRERAPSPQPSPASGRGGKRAERVRDRDGIRSGTLAGFDRFLFHKDLRGDTSSSPNSRPATSDTSRVSSSRAVSMPRVVSRSSRKETLRKPTLPGTSSRMPGS